jgi:hypothetical protein
MKIRLPADLKSDIEQAAVTQNRTLNAEIVSRLESSFTNEPASDELREQLEHWKQKFQYRDHAVSLYEFLVKILATYVVDLYEHLPAEKVSGEPAKTRAAFAKALLDKDGVSLAATFGALTGVPLADREAIRAEVEAWPRAAEDSNSKDAANTSSAAEPKST